MAGDWLKVEVSTPDKPEIFYMAEALSLTSDDVFGKCFRVWAWFDAHTLDGKCNGVIVTKMLVDRCAGITGFANAMLKVNWLLDGESGLTIPNFDRHNGETAKQRALSAKRVAKSRAKSNAECNGDSVTLSQPEKRREEKIKTSIPPDFSISENVRKWAHKNGHTQLEKHLEHFINFSLAKDYKNKDWDAAFRNAISANWAKVELLPTRKLVL